MGFLDRLFGTEEQEAQRAYPRAVAQRTQALSDDELALERYRYLVRTAPPEQLEQAHAEAFERLTPEQRRLLLASLAAQAPAGEQPQSDSPQDLARAATRAEIRQPGTMERALGGEPGQRGPGFGSMVMSSMLGSVAGYVIASALMSAFLPSMGDLSAAGDSGGDASGDAGADAAGFETGADTGTGDGFGDFGGSDFGGGDFGGGDFGGDFGF